MLDSLLGDVGQHGICTAERHHRHFAEEHGNLAEHIGLAECSQITLQAVGLVTYLP